MSWSELFLYFLAVTLPILAILRICANLLTGFCKSECRMDGKTVLITGANTGIGKETAIDLASRGARVILACRNVKKGNEAKEEITQRTGNTNVLVGELDLCSLHSVTQFAREVLKTEERLDVLINNAGDTRLGEQKTRDGLDPGMQVNHFGPLLLTILLTALLRKSAPSRIIFVSSAMHRFVKFDLDNLNFEKSYVEQQVYRYSKLANILTANELARRLKGTGVTVNSLHPGIVRTTIWNKKPFPIKLFYWLMLEVIGKSAYEGAQTTIHLAVSEEVEEVTGKYFVDCKEAPSQLSKQAQDQQLAHQVWNRSEHYLKLK